MIYLEQILHGYSDGHRMLEASIDISDLDQRVMLMMSDLSGSGYSENGQAYLTGYPLQTSPFYVLSKTWYANEMERPGCVWTHSLLISFDTLNLIKDPNILLNLFNKPNPQNGFENYSQNIQIIDYSKSINSSSDFNKIFLKEIILALYTKETRSVVVIKEKDANFEETTMKIWMQQWPLLRKYFTFCTGSLSNRKINKKSLDFQICERKNISEFKRNNLKPIILDSNNISLNRIYPEWINIALSDWNNIDNEVYSEIDNSLFDHLGNKRSNYQSYMLMQNKFYKNIISGNVGEILNSLIELDENDEMRDAISTSLFGIDSIILKYRYVKDYQCEEELLLDLISNPKFSFLSSDSLQIQERTEVLIYKKNRKIFDLLYQKKELALSTHSYVFFQTVSQNIDSDTFVNIAATNEKIGAFIASQKPSLTCNDTFLKQKNIDFDVLFEAVFLINNDKVNSKIVKSLINKMLNLRVEFASEIIYEAYKHETIYTILEWICSNDKNNLDILSNWRKILQKDLELCIQWLNNCKSLNKNLLIILIEIFQSENILISYQDSIILSKAISDVYLQFKEKELKLIAEFSFILSLTNEGKFSQKIIDISYKLVDKSIRENSISWYSWSKIEKILPEAAWYEKWDRAKRLRKYLLQKNYKVY